MKCVKGKPVSPGYGEGRAYVYRSESSSERLAETIRPERVQDELERFDRAIRRAVSEMQELKRQVAIEIGEAEAGVFAVHLAFLNDPDFVQNVKRRVNDELVNVEHALRLQIENFGKRLAALDNQYISERDQDIRDIGNRLLKHLGQSNGEGRDALRQLARDSVLVAVELLPSDTIQVDRKMITAIVTER